MRRAKRSPSEGVGGTTEGRNGSAVFSQAVKTAVLTSGVHDQGDDSPIDPAKDQDLSGRDRLVSLSHDKLRIRSECPRNSLVPPRHVQFDTWFTLALRMRVTGSTLSGQRSLCLGPSVVVATGGAFLFSRRRVGPHPPPCLGCYWSHGKSVRVGRAAPPKGFEIRRTITKQHSRVNDFLH